MDILTTEYDGRGSAHLSISMAGLVPGAEVPRYGHSLEQTFYVNDGRADSPEGPEPWLNIAGDIGIAARAPESARSSQGCAAGTLNLLGSFRIASSTIFTTDALLGCILAVAYTVAYWTFAPNLAVNMSWNIVSLAVIFPISQCIGMGFTRREQALAEFSYMLGNMRSVWGAVHTWKVKNSQGQFIRAMMSFEEPDVARYQLRALFEEFLAALAAYFAVPRWNRARQNAPLCREDEKEQVDLINISHEQRLRVDHTIGRMQRLVQQLKAQGLPGGEAHRLDQCAYATFFYALQRLLDNCARLVCSLTRTQCLICIQHYCNIPMSGTDISKIGIAFERLCAIKEYRTPQAFRAFARVYILIIGALYGPYYLHIGQFGLQQPDHPNSSTSGESPSVVAQDRGSLAFALVFACSIQLVMSGLFHIMLGLEDPFVRRGGSGQVDSINVPQVIEVSRRQLLSLEADGTQDWTVHSDPTREKAC